MMFTVCDIDGRVPAQSYKLATGATTCFSIDLCDTCADDMQSYIRKLVRLEGVRAVVKPLEVSK